MLNQLVFVNLFIQLIRRAELSEWNISEDVKQWNFWKLFVGLSLRRIIDLCFLGKLLSFQFGSLWPSLLLDTSPRVIFYENLCIREFEMRRGSSSLPQYGRVVRSDKHACPGMQILNELMKIKNGRGKRVRLISKTSLFQRSRDAAHSCEIRAPAAIVYMGFNSVKAAGPPEEELRLTTGLKSILQPVIAGWDATVATWDYYLQR